MRNPECYRCGAFETWEHPCEGKIVYLCEECANFYYCWRLNKRMESLKREKENEIDKQHNKDTPRYPIIE